MEISKYQSADQHTSAVEQIVSEYDPEKKHGYFLVDEFYVPYAFLDRLYGQFMRNNFEYGSVFTLDEICGEAFLDSLDPHEIWVLGPCIRLILEGRFAMTSHKVS